MSGVRLRPYPFSAVVGNDIVKKAFMCALVDTGSTGVLISGAAGTGKSTILSSIASITDRRLVTVPQNITEDRLYGSIDVERAISTGKAVFDKGVLSESDGNILRIDDMDLIDGNMMNSIVSSVEAGEVVIERDGISGRYPLDTFILATTSRPFRALDRDVLDRFDMCVPVDVYDIPQRMESLPNELAFQDGDEQFLRSYRVRDKDVAQRIAGARELFPSVVMSRVQIRAVSALCVRYAVDGFRGELACSRVSRALAALAGRTKVSTEDLVEAVQLCLNHSRNVSPEEEEAEPQQREQESGKSDDPDEVNEVVVASFDAEYAGEESSGPSAVADDPDDETDKKKIILRADRMFHALDLLKAKDALGIDADPRKKVAESPVGRFTGSRIPKDAPKSIAVYATMREAITHSRVRGHVSGGSLDIRVSDVREKIITQRCKNTFLFMLDTSWSITIRNRMSKVKAAILSMLETHYVNRDKVGLFTFNEESMEMVMEPSRNLDVLSRMIDKIPAGSGTPLPQAFAEVHSYMVPYLRKRPTESCHIILMTDGKASRGMNPNKSPVAESLEIAAEMNLPNTDWIVVDIGLGFTKNDIPEKLARALNGRFFLLDDLEVKDTVSRLW